MITVVIGGSASGVGKTRLACGVIRSLPEFAWTAIKISRHEHGGSEAVFEETRAGQGSDTARYLEAGARRSLLVKAIGTELPMAEIDSACGGSTHTLIESNRVLDAVIPDVCLAIVGDGVAKPSFEPVLHHADAVVVCRHELLEGLQPPASACIFCMEDLSCPPPEFVDWLRGQIATASARLKKARP